MKPKYKLKSWVVICIYIIALGAVVTSLFLVGQTLKVALPFENLSYVYHGIVSEDYPVVNTPNEEIIKPYLDENITIAKNYYDMSADAKIQENALILYANTYMQNTGILYSSKETFDIICVMDGTVEDIKTDEIMGNIVTIKHTNNLVTTYHSLKDVHVMVGTVLKQGDIIGTSGGNKITTESENMLLFEVCFNGVAINPETFYQMDLKDLS